MAVFRRMNQETIQKEFTHYGWFLGLVPIYWAEDGDDGFVLQERNWVPEWSIEVAESLFGFVATIRSLLDWSYEPEYPILLTGLISKE